MFIAIENQKIEIKWFKPAFPQKGPTLVFLHEGLGCVSLWKNFPEKVSQTTGLEAFVYSRLGYGNSDPCRLPRKINFMHQEGIHFLPKLIKAAGIKNFILVGHSDGGSISIIFSGHHDHPGQKGLITIAAHVFCETLSIESIEKAKYQYEQGGLKQKLEKYHGLNTEDAFRGWNDVWLTPRFRHFNIEKYLPSIKVPFLAIQGSDDPYGTNRQMYSIAKNSHHSAVQNIKDAGHAPHFTHEKTVLNSMSDHIFMYIHTDCEPHSEFRLTNSNSFEIKP